MSHVFLQRLRLPLASAVGLSLLSLPLVMPQAQALPLVRAARWNAVAGPVPVAAYGAAVYHPGWEANSYWVGRPWAYGWYGGAPVAWATAANVVSSAAIVSAVNASVAVQSPLIVVPYTPYRLNYASVLALPNGRVSFNSLAAGVASASQGDCRLGLLNGVAAEGPQAQLLHAACTVAYGAGG